MLTAALVVAGLAALLHVYIFVMESLTWTSPRTRATFGLSAEEAEATKELAFNQGFYNLFLAVVTGIGVGAALAGHGAVGAALVLLVSSPDKARAAVTQGVLPLIAVLLMGIQLVTA